MSPKALIIAAALAAAAIFVFAQDQTLAPGRVRTVVCTIIRKNSYNGFSKVVKGTFCYEARTNRASYEYGAPFGFRFIVCDTAIIGIDIRRNSGYVWRRGRDDFGCTDLYSSVHFFDPYLACVNADTALLSLSGRTDSHTYFERRNLSSTDVLARNDESGAYDCIESFDGQGALYRQVKARFDENEGVYDFPVRIVVRNRCGDLITSDTVIISNARVNGAIPTGAFAPPDHCRLQPIDDMRHRLFLTGPK